MQLKENILRSAVASKKAYAPPQLLKSKHANLPSNQIYDSRTRTSLYVWDTGDSSKMVAFRGSTHIKDILNYMECYQTMFAFAQYKMKIHTGVLDMFSSIEPELSATILNNNGASVSNLTFCGHSLGGALAIIAATYYGMMLHKRCEINCHTFGTPKVGNKELSLVFNDHVNESYHFINNNDIVPMFPVYPLDYSLPLKHVIRLYDTSDLMKAHDLDTYIDNLRKHIYITKFPRHSS